MNLSTKPKWFTPYNPESPGVQTGDEGNFKYDHKEKPRPLGRGYTGFTLIEVLIAVVILSISLLALAGLMVTTTRNNSYGSHMTEASTFAQDRMEELRVTAWGNIISGADQKKGSTGIDYARSWNVVTNADGTLRTITLTISWNDGANHSIRLFSALSQ